jgi:hypothetical protein
MPGRILIWLSSNLFQTCLKCQVWETSAHTTDRRSIGLRPSHFEVIRVSRGGSLLSKELLKRRRDIPVEVSVSGRSRRKYRLVHANLGQRNIAVSSGILVLTNKRLMRRIREPGGEEERFIPRCWSQDAKHS